MNPQLRSYAGNTVDIEVGPVMRDASPVEIASSTAALPLEVTTKTAHGCSVGDEVIVSGHLLNGAANGRHEVLTVPSATRLTLKGIEGLKVGGATGELTRLIPVDLSLGGTQMWFTAKQRRALTDVEAVPLQKTELSGITLNSPASAKNNRATITIAPADTSAIVKTTDYVYDVELLEPGGRRSTVAEGDWQVQAVVTRT